ncbi:MAG: hypothetical protein J5661_07725 [Bacteroidaceae bacterium]|nr:hypothetical protein [Bacteroidaceae bacterium]
MVRTTLFLLLATCSPILQAQPRKAQARLRGDHEIVLATNNCDEGNKASANNVFTEIYPLTSEASRQILPSEEVLQRPFGKKDRALFKEPDSIFRPEIWVDCLCGNLSQKGIKADLQAIREAGFRGVQMFFGNRGGAWPGVEQVLCLSPQWEQFVQYAAEEAHRQGLRFTLQCCPGWAMAGGPWIEPEKAMRHLVWSRTDILSDTCQQVFLPKASKAEDQPWRDYRDLMVLAFPTPKDDTGSELGLSSIEPALLGHLPQTDEAHPHTFLITLTSAQTIRSVEFSSVQQANHHFCYDPGIHGRLEALYPDGSQQTLFDTEWPQSNWQDEMPLTLACRETPPTKQYRLTIVNRHAGMSISSFRLFSSARKNGWENEAAWCLRSILPTDTSLQQNENCYIQEVYDLTSHLCPDGSVYCELPAGQWTLLRIGHVNTGKKNAPAPPEATGFECDKFSIESATTHFDGYIGRLKEGVLKNSLDGMLMDSWECETQTWTPQMEEEFRALCGYDLRPWIPALMGYVVKDVEKTARFLHDWRSLVNYLVVNHFYATMSDLAHRKGLSITYETAGGDVFPSDIMEYFKWADLPMCEFWVHDSETFVGTLNFKPIKPTASAARLYGKPRVAAEAFTSMQQTWDEQLSILRETANTNYAEGVSYLIFQAYTHNPRPDELVPGSSFGDGIGTPFLRAQTWWKYMSDFTRLTARTSFLLERGKPVSDVLWYLGDEIDHKPDQQAPFPKGYKYDYCNTDVLHNRLQVKNGCLLTPEGITYRMLWLPRTDRMLPATLVRLLELSRQGAIIVGERPRQIATLVGGKEAERQFEEIVRSLWDEGRILSSVSLEESLKRNGIEPDLLGDGIQWTHRQVTCADWYYLCAPKGRRFEGEISVRTKGKAELWDPLTGEITPLFTKEENGRTIVKIVLERAESRFLVFCKTARRSSARESSVEEVVCRIEPWHLWLPSGWGQEEETILSELRPLRVLPLTEEARAFSGTMTYTTSFWIEKKERKAHYELSLGRVEQIAHVTLNGHTLRPLWTPPYRLSIDDLLKEGKNDLRIEVTNTWFNRLVYDALLPEAERKTWTTNYPAPGTPLRESGLIGPVRILVSK